MDLDLRATSQDKSPLGEDINYIFKKGSYYKKAIDFSGNDYILTRDIIECIFECVNNNKPVFFHCQQGKDRTGTISLLLLGVLGVSQSDCDKEYELTSFAAEYDYRNFSYRSVYNSDNDSLSYRAMIDYLSTFEGACFAEKVCSWMIHAGISIDKINEFRHNMSTGDTPDLVSKVNP